MDTQWSDVIKPATVGTKALLPGTRRRCVHFLAIPGGQMQCVRQLMDMSSMGVERRFFRVDDL